MPRLPQFASTTENLRFKSAIFELGNEDVVVKVYLHEEAKTYVLSITLDYHHLDWQVSSAAQISNSLSPTVTFSAVGHLILGHSAHSQSSGEHNEADLTEWLKFSGCLGT